ncbi:nucleotide exchange factor GrpE [Patescibacteria group bacterium]|nr:MAG: nucleotide exchange factor GrpE [Patescibacteria group bacterium]
MNEEQKKQEVEKVDKVAEVAKENRCEKCDEYLAGWKRALADYDNLQKDLARERTEIRTRVKQEVAYQLIAVLDNFDQAAKFTPEGLGKELEDWVRGLMLVKTQLEGVMREMGLEPFGSVGELFDAHVHDAGGERTEEEKIDQEILEVVTRGWKLGERVVRPAKVIINNLINSKPL